MSYDIFAFDLATAPSSDGILTASWYEQQVEWHEPHSYKMPAVTTLQLRSFYYESILTFPPAEDLEPFDTGITVGEYSIGYSLIYASFHWEHASQARELFLSLGIKHNVGVCEISQNPAVVHRPRAT